MDLWNKQGYFPKELRIQCVGEDKWTTLQEFETAMAEKAKEKGSDRNHDE